MYHQLGPLCFFFLVLLLGFIFIFCLRYPKYNLRPERENKSLVFGFNKSAGFSFHFYFLREIKVKPGQGPTDTDKRFSHPAPLSRQLTVIQRGLKTFMGIDLFWFSRYNI